MKKINKKYILIIIIVVALVVLFLIFKDKINIKSSNETQTATEKLGDATINGLEINNFNMTLEDGSTTIIAVATNITDSEMYVKYINYVLKDKDGNEIGKSYFYVDKTLKSNESTIMQSGFSKDVTSTNKVEYTLDNN
jgi:hypothetical protein